ncbi:HAD-IIA family hydrolase [Cryobacterium levicorallinum]|uniref:HAD-IIA family hydrolase n=1 Tax=Cryobacterium levicorallinum TaxID=995038 RepID=A0A1I2Y5U0_9MICO|nr:HAD-IIA family hydrolase [Cryobacterium levicorallinum]TFB85162.1 HAD-IIA family hydrolase [Cryobacterium levicorallinum]GEP27428.1 acid sugar phosphatase [Cryobacterium levicorallinum]SFH20729.1 Haloacid Dehalogenase Superfamily Class (subfamily) IIA [Cryobacterium levicorallinum]
MITSTHASVESLRTSPLRIYPAYVFDLDGTIYLGDKLLPGARRLIEYLQERGSRTVFLSNNPTLDPGMYVEKFERLGLQINESDVVNSVVSIVAWLQREHPGAVVFPIAEAPLIRALGNAGIRMSEDPQEIDIVIASYDRTFDYRKLQIAFDAIWQFGRAILVTTNPDRFCPFPGGRGQPDAAAIVAAIEACTGVKSQANAGKPDQIMIDTVIEALKMDVRDCIMVGDRLYTDIQMALNAVMDSALVLTGDSSIAMVEERESDQRPSFVLDRVDHLIPTQLRDELGWNI